MTSGLDSDKLNQLTNFVGASNLSTPDDRLQAALLLSGVEGTNYDAVIQHLRQGLRNPNVVLVLQSRQCSSLQSSLKAIIRAAIVEYSDLAAYEEHLSKHKRLFPLNFDLELLEQFVQVNSLRHVVVCLSDVETYDGSLLNDLIISLRSWQDRIPFTLLLGVTSTAQLLEYRLSKSCLKLLDARIFDFLPSNDLPDTLLACAQTTGNGASHIFLGPSVVNHLHEISQGQGTAVRALRSALEYLYMSHFFANPLSLLVGQDTVLNNRQLARAIRCTESFGTHCEELLEEQTKTSTERVRRLLENDDDLLEEAKQSIAEGQIAYAQVVRIIEAWSDLYECLSKVDQKLRRTKFEVTAELYQSMADFTDSASYFVVETCINNLSASQLLAACERLQSRTCDILALTTLIDDLTNHDQNTTDGVTERSDGHNNNTSKGSGSGKKLGRASQKLQHTSRPSNASFIETLRQKLQASSLDITCLFLHEAYIISSSTIRFKQNFESNPRVAIERALLKPGDYLGCECCTEGRKATSDGGDSQRGHERGDAHLPPASILFTLMQEAPTTINVRDLFDAFQSRFQPTTSVLPVNGVEEQTAPDAGILVAMTQFYRALAELRMLGLVKPSTGTQVKKRAVGGKTAKASGQDIDFVAKTSWAGL